MERWIDQNPDHRRSSSGLDIVAQRKDDVWFLPVKGCGAIVVRMRGADLLTLSTFTDAEIGWRD